VSHSHIAQLLQDARTVIPDICVFLAGFNFGTNVYLVFVLNTKKYEAQIQKSLQNRRLGI
jgi:hypothetical protein